MLCSLSDRPFLSKQQTQQFFLCPSEPTSSLIHSQKIMYVQYKIMRIKHLALLFLTNIFIH